MKPLRRAGYRLLHFGLPILLLGLAGASISSDKANALPSATPDEHGPVTAIALDINGNGVFATGREDGYFNSFPLENGRTPYLTHGDPTNRYTGVTRIAMTAKGDMTWWIGFQDVDRKPLLWGPTPLKLSPTLELTDVVLAADGHDGWLVGRDRKSNAGMLWRMRSGKWTSILPPAGALLRRVAISSDGAHGWGIGMSRATPTVFRLSKGRWSVLPGNPFPKGHVGKLVTVDDAGNGWIIAGPPKERTGPSSLIRLTRTGKLYVVPVKAPTTGVNPEPPLVLSALDVDTQGNGWAVGSLYLGATVVDPYTTPSDQYRPVPVRLLGDRATTFPAEAVGIMGNGYYNSKEANIYPTELVIGPDGVQTMLGGIYAGSGNGILNHLHEPWTYPNPPSARALPGAGKCFEATPYCLRGELALAWEQAGGVEKLGYPITPELEGTTRLPPSHPQYGEVVTIQYTERARLEYAWYTTPEVTLGQLGRDWEAHLQKGSNPTRQQDMAPFASTIKKHSPGWTWFPSTQHNIGPPFLKHWQNNRGLVVYGTPISEAFNERSTDGKTYLVQYFERSRLEYHPELAGAGKDIMVGRLGVQVFQSTYGFVP